MVPAAAQKEPRPQAATGKAALDKDALESYVRHLWVLGQDYEVSISDPKASTDLPGFNEVTVHISEGGATQDVPLFVSKDGSKIIQGTVYDLQHNPFKTQLDTLKTSFHPSMGTPGAPVVLAEFSDLECPHCKRQHEMLKENLLKTYPQEVRLYFMDFPLSIHPWAKPAAIAGRCVFNQKPEAFWSYADSIFDRQESITPENFKSSVMEWAKSRQDIDALQLGRCMTRSRRSRTLTRMWRKGGLWALTRPQPSSSMAGAFPRRRTGTR
jgi:hypothetical protein